jgi:hypothetical protein
MGCFHPELFQPEGERSPSIPLEGAAQTTSTSTPSEVFPQPDEQPHPNSPLGEAALAPSANVPPEHPQPDEEPTFPIPADDAAEATAPSPFPDQSPVPSLTIGMEHAEVERSEEAPHPTAVEVLLAASQLKKADLRALALSLKGRIPYDSLAADGELHSPLQPVILAARFFPSLFAICLAKIGKLLWVALEDCQDPPCWKLLRLCS